LSGEMSYPAANNPMSAADSPGAQFSYPMGMWHATDRDPFTDSLHTVTARELQAMSGGDGSIINFIWGSNFIFGGASNYRVQWHKDLLMHLNDANVYLVPNVRFTSADYTSEGDCILRDGRISDEEFTKVARAIDDILDFEQNLIDTPGNGYTHSRIIGWAIMDEPFAINNRIRSQNLDTEGCGTPALVEPGPMKSYRDRLYNHLERRNFPNRKFYLSEGASMGRTVRDGLFRRHKPIVQNYAEFADSYDVLAIFYYDYIINSENSHLTDGGEWYNHGNQPEGSLRGWNYIWEKVQQDLGPDTDKEIHAILVLGEEVPVRGANGGLNYDTFQPDYLQTHAMTHVSIRKMYEMGFDGISFYDWKHIPDEYREDAICWWEQEVADLPQCADAGVETSPYYREAVATEIHDRASLVLSFSAPGADGAGTVHGFHTMHPGGWASNDGADVLTDAAFVFGDNGSTAASAEPSPSGTVTDGIESTSAAGMPADSATHAGRSVLTEAPVQFIATGDLWEASPATPDATFLLASTERRSTNADGDDELVSFAAGPFQRSATGSVSGAPADVQPGSDPGTHLHFHESPESPLENTHAPLSLVGERYVTDHLRLHYSCTDLPCEAAAETHIVTALTTGDFDGDGDAELVMALYDTLHRTGSVHISPNGLSPASLSFSLPDSVTALAAGDFNRNGRASLVAATRNGMQTRIFHADIASGEPLFSEESVISHHTDIPIVVRHMAAGNFDGSFRDQLLIALEHTRITWSRLTLSQPGASSLFRDPLWSGSTIWTSMSYRVTALVAGHFYGGSSAAQGIQTTGTLPTPEHARHHGRTDQLVSAFTHVGNGETLVFSAALTDGDNPWQQMLMRLDAVRVNSLGAGQFRESLQHVVNAEAPATEPDS